MCQVWEREGGAPVGGSVPAPCVGVWHHPMKAGREQRSNAHVCMQGRGGGAAREHAHSFSRLAGVSTGHASFAGRSAPLVETPVSS